MSKERRSITPPAEGSGDHSPESSGSLEVGARVEFYIGSAFVGGKRQAGIKLIGVVEKIMPTIVVIRGDDKMIYKLPPGGLTRIAGNYFIWSCEETFFYFLY